MLPWLSETGDTRQPLYYKCRGLFLQYGELNDMDTSVLKSLHLNNKEQQEGTALAIEIRQDAFGNLSPSANPLVRRNLTSLQETHLTGTLLARLILLI